MDETELALNRARWDEVAESHRLSYDTQALIDQPDRISEQVAADAELLAPWLPGGSVAGLDLIHLQCHIGHDSLGWARLGARVTGLDMSAESLRVARELAAQAGIAAEFVQSTIARAGEALAGRSFDLVYTSVGVLCWLDDLDGWAKLIAQLLRPGGLFLVRDDHPMAAALDETAPPGELRLGWPYFNVGPISEESTADYSSATPLVNAKTWEWAHSLGETIGALLRAGLIIRDYQEYQSLPWRRLEWMEPADDGWRYALPRAVRDRCPLEFSLIATKAG
ncbi:MAG: class I SAM-dependent methyltransferase [Propionibacteriaceae bacterium]|jgi:SAM-dependent methyltransferase|nr:class I SAM-dependent methyltransferase [Propionibacteriaceae bacterium]